MKLDIPKVLVVDDDPVFCEALARWLNTLGYRNAAVNSVEQAAEVIDPAEVDVILLDVRLPGLRGHVLLQQLNRQGIENLRQFGAHTPARRFVLGRPRRRIGFVRGLSQHRRPRAHQSQQS